MDKSRNVEREYELLREFLREPITRVTARDGEIRFDDGLGEKVVIFADRGPEELAKGETRKAKEEEGKQDMPVNPVPSAQLSIQEWAALVSGIWPEIEKSKMYNPTSVLPRMKGMVNFDEAMGVFLDTVRFMLRKLALVVGAMIVAFAVGWVLGGILY